MSEMRNSESSYHEQLRAEVRLRDGINTCRRVAGVTDGQPVSIATVDMGAALITTLRRENDARPKFSSISTLGGLRRYLKLGADHDTQDIYYVDTTGAPGISPFRASIDGFTITIEDLGKQTDTPNAHALLMGDENLAALWRIGDILHGKELVEPGRQLFIDCKQSSPCTHIEGAETGIMPLKLFDLLGADTTEQFRERFDLFGPQTLWSSTAGLSSIGLEVDYVKTWQQKSNSNRYGYLVKFQTNPYGEGEALIAAVIADFSGTEPTDSLIKYSESKPFTHRHAGEDRPIALDPTQRAMVHDAILTQVVPNRLSVLRPYA